MTKSCWYMNVCIIVAGPIEMKYVKMLQDVKHYPPVVDIKHYAKAWVPSNTTGGDYRDKYWIFQNMPDEDASRENPTLGKLTTLDERLRVALALLVFVESLKALQLPLLHRGARRCLALPLLRRETRVKSRLLLLVVLLCACSLSLHGLYGARSWAHAFQSVTSALVRMSRLGEALGDGGACATLVYLSFRLLAIILVMSLGKWV
ncbi:unnamed protein product [Lampetra planeri]